MLWPTLHAVASRAEDESLLVNLLCGRACDTDLPTHRAAELRLSVATHLCSNTKWQAAAERGASGTV